MKKLSVITTLFLCVCAFILPAQAVLLEYNLEGNVVENTGDPFGWSDEPFSLKFTIDSSQPPWIREHNIFGDAYRAVSSFFCVGGQQIPLSPEYTSIGFWKLSGFYPYDQVEIHWANEADSWGGLCTLNSHNRVII